MAIEVNGKILRNIQEQVQKNKDDIEFLSTTGTALNTFGIKVIENFDTYQEFQQWEASETHTHEYGDAVIVGTNEPYDMYVWTRASLNRPEDYWLDLGKYPLAGPKGERGEKGIQGNQGRASQWYAGQGEPNSSLGEVGDAYYNQNNYCIYFKTSDEEWTSYGSIRGQQGVQGERGLTGLTGSVGPVGPAGPTGPTGTAVHVIGIIPSTTQLPSPELVADLTAAYLVGASQPYMLYIQVGNEPSEAIWTNMGEFNPSQSGFWENNEGSLIPVDAIEKVIINNLEANGLKVGGTDILTLLAAKQNQLIDSTDITTDQANKKLFINQEIKNKLNRSLMTPVSAPGTTILAGINQSNAQTNITVGNGLKIENNELKLNGSIPKLYQHFIDLTFTDGDIGYVCFSILRDNNNQMSVRDIFNFLSANGFTGGNGQHIYNVTGGNYTSYRGVNVGIYASGSNDIGVFAMLIEDDVPYLDRSTNDIGDIVISRYSIINIF